MKMEISRSSLRDCPGISGIVPLVALCLAGVWALSALAAGESKTSDSPASREVPTVQFDRDIRPILAAKCVQCHGPGTAEAGLRLDRAASAVSLLESGNYALVAGHPEQSELIRRVTADELERMPPEGQPLDAVQVNLLRQWISEGAIWPDHWAYRPLQKPVPPQFHSLPDGTQREQWIRNPIDRFVLKKLLDAGLQPASEADRRALIRRLSFDLTGLPPLPEDVDAFLADTSPRAYEDLVDRLLASPRYGERWARHWMDVVHYADSHGFEHDLARQIWPYRDYLVNAFNEDRPYAQFVREQLAGDALFPGDALALEATGFLATGPWDLSAQQAGNANSIDKLIAQNQDRDDVVSTVMSTFVSSTVHCARCHDHKFDPITQEDYYNLQAVFAGIDKAHRMYDADPGVAEKRAGLHARLAQLEADSQSRDLAWITPEVLMQADRWEAELRNRQPHWQPLQLVEFHSANGSELSLQPDGSLLSSGPRPERDTYTITTQTTLPEISAVRVEVLTDESLPHLGPGRQENGNLHLNEVVFKASPASDPSSLQSLKTQSPRADFNQNGWAIDKAFDNNPQTAWGIYPQVGASHTFFVELAEPLKNASEQLLTLELQQTHGGGHLIGKLRLSAVSDPLSASVDFTPLPEEIAAILEIPSPDRTSDQRRIITAYCLKLDLEHQIAELPAQKQLYCGTNNFEAKGGFRPAVGPREIHLLKRGEITQPGPLAVPGTLSCVPNLPSKFELAQPENEALRRVALADWVADPRNVLTWRSIVNRIWHNHFGQGIVKTPNDFGHMGASPTHPELLDWLAVTFRDQGGSIKDLHRLIVCSATYRQASTHNSDAAQLDSNNQLLWRMNRQRLDAESIHDALLLLAGRLNTQMGGPPVKQFIETKTFNLRPEADYEHFNVDDPGNQRRSLYRFIYRTIPDPFMSALDCPDGTQLTPVRSESTTALQALAMLNDKFVIRQSEHLAEKLKTSQSELPDQVRAAFQLLLSREADLEEQQLVSDYAREYGLANACRFLMNTNEFLILD